MGLNVEEMKKENKSFKELADNFAGIGHLVDRTKQWNKIEQNKERREALKREVLTFSGPTTDGNSTRVPYGYSPRQ